MLDERCPIPYTVARQSNVLEAYARVSLKISSALPVSNSVTNANLTAFRSEFQSIIAGEAQQAIGAVRSAYICRLKNSLPENKHAYIDLMESEMSRMTVGLFLQSNFADFNATNALFDQLEARAEEALPRWDAIPVADRVTRAEVEAAIGTPDFTSRIDTRTGFEANIGSAASVGACKGTVQATLAAVDNSTIAALANLKAILGNLAADGSRFVAYSDLATAASGVFQPGTAAQISSQIAGANGAARTQAQSCMNTVSATVIQNISQSVAATIPASPQPANTRNGI